MKKILILLLVFLNTYLLFGCAQTTYVITYKTNGEITQTFSTLIDINELQEKGYSYLELSSTIHNLYSNYWNNKYEYMQSNLNKNEELTQQEKTQILNSVTKDISVIENELTLTITYPNSKVANLVNTDPTQEEQDSDVKYIENFLTRTMVQNVTNIYSGYHESELYNELNAIYNKNNEFSDNDLKLTHVIAFSNSRYKSNANKRIFKNGLYYHIWDVNTTVDVNNEYASTKIEIYLTTAKPVMWYLLAVIITGLFIIFSFVYIKYSKIKQKSLK